MCLKTYISCVVFAFSRSFHINRSCHQCTVSVHHLQASSSPPQFTDILHPCTFPLDSFLAGPGAQVWAASNNVETCQPEELVAGELCQVLLTFCLVTTHKRNKVFSFPMIGWPLLYCFTSLLDLQDVQT